VDEKHKLPNGDQVFGEETGTIEYRIPSKSGVPGYEEGK
jgi:hypothetical protein